MQKILQMCDFYHIDASVLKKDLWLNKNKVRECAGFKPTHKTINYNQTRLINYITA
jgi:hypothetical protein